MNDHTQSKPSSKVIKTLAVLLIAGLLAFPALIGCSTTGNQTGTNDNGSEPEPTSPPSNTVPVKVEEGVTAPDFSFTTSDGTTANLSDYQGKVVLLNFWATWCGYCIQEMPAMQELKENYPDVEILTVNRGDAPSDAEAFIEESSYDFTWALDEDRSIERLYPANGIPYSVIIDKDGVVGTIYEGSSADMYPHFERAITSAGA